MLDVKSGTAPLIRRFDAQLGRELVTLKPGEFFATRDGEVISTVLGSCIAVCLRDAKCGVGGMNHFMLPAHKAGYSSESWSGASARYGVAAMEYLINDILKMGGRREYLEAKLFGGGCVLPGMTDIGRINIEFIRSFVATEQLRVVGEDLGGNWPRQLQYEPSTGKARMRYINRDDQVVASERRYRDELMDKQAAAGSVDLF